MLWEEGEREEEGGLKSATLCYTEVSAMYAEGGGGGGRGRGGTALSQCCASDGVGAATSQAPILVIHVSFLVFI